TPRAGIPERSEFVQEVLGRIPSVFIRTGTIFFFCFILLLLWMSYLIKYPDIIISRVSLLTEQPPVEVLARESGRLEQLNISEKKWVEAGERLALIESTAKLGDIDRLDSFLLRVATLDTPEEMSKIKIPENLQLGSIQALWAGFSEDLKNLSFFETTVNAHQQQISSIKKQIEFYNKLNERSQQQQELLQREVDLAMSDFNRKQELFESGNVSAYDKEIAEANYLAYKRQLDNLSNQVISNGILIEQLQSRLTDLQQGRVNQSTTMLITLKEKIQNLQSAIKDWKYRFLIEAPISGHLSLMGVWSENQYVNNGEKLFSIIPESEGHILGKMVMPEYNSGKVGIGQKVIIRLDGYPHQEFGTIEGKVESVSLLPNDQLFYVDVSLPNGLESTYGKEISFVQEMQGTAEIVTEDLRLIHRIFYQIIKAFERT
ncbi:MAG: HlyD family efflux transporter periplasmic adaptor subunit, partial [Phaeodactylibacter sp.]|nr:HlyD family efflux transporter periplasmic adaptor subunit [Phaeodactylibacter sp.]